MQSNLETIMNTMSSLVNKIREDLKNINFVQIGSHDCTTYEDLPSNFIKSEDLGHFIEPVDEAFSKLKSNRFEYVNSKFHNLSILPNDEFYSEFFHVDTKGCQSTYIKGIYYDDKTENENWVLSKPSSQSIKTFIESNNIQTPNVYFVSTQGYDNDIIREILNIHSPNIFFAESWDMEQINNVIETNRTETPKNVKFTSRDEIINILQSKGYKCLYETTKDRLLAWNLSYDGVIEHKNEEVTKTKTLGDGNKYISYSLFGSDLKYYVGAEKNVLINNRLLPDWDTVIYYHPNNFRHEYLEKLSKLGAIMVDVSKITIGNKSSESFPYFWRFLVFLTNSLSLSRDLDSRLSDREVEYIRRWEKSGKDYFVIRDHPWHSPYPSGLLGLSRKIDSFEVHLNNYISSNELVWGTDQDILEKYFADKNAEDVFYCGYDRIETYIPRDNKDFFIGMQIDEFDNPTVPSAVKSIEYLNELNLPTNFKKKYTYFFTTLAINKFYFENSLKFFMKLHDLTKSCFLNITTTKNDLKELQSITNMTLSEFNEKYPNILLNSVEDFNFRMNFPLEMNGVGFTFNVNLKALAIKSCLNSKRNFDYLIYVDGDWHVHDEFSEEKIMNLFDTMEKNNIDFGFERPAKIADGRKNPSECFYMEKLYDYNCLENNMWDEAHVANEQFLVFKNGWKLTLFEQKWEQMLWYTVMNNIRNYAEGFEIGVCALESGMKWDFYVFPLLRNCFYFYPKYSEVRHTRF